MTMKRKIVMGLKFPTNDDQKSRAKVLKISVSMPGTISSALEGSDKDRLVVFNEGLDTVKLTRLLRKKMGRAELINVTPVELTWLPRKNIEKKDEERARRKTREVAAARRRTSQTIVRRKTTKAVAELARRMTRLMEN